MWSLCAWKPRISIFSKKRKIMKILKYIQVNYKIGTISNSITCQFSSKVQNSHVLDLHKRHQSFILKWQLFFTLHPGGNKCASEFTFPITFGRQICITNCFIGGFNSQACTPIQIQNKHTNKSHLIMWVQLEIQCCNLYQYQSVCKTNRKTRPE